MTTAKDQHGIDLDIKDAMEGHERFRLEFERDSAFYQEPGVEEAEAPPAVDRLLPTAASCRRKSPVCRSGRIVRSPQHRQLVPPADAYDDAVGAAIEYGAGAPRHRRHRRVRTHRLRRHRRRCWSPSRPTARRISGAGSNLPAGPSVVAAARCRRPSGLPATIKAHVQFQLDNLMTYPIVRPRASPPGASTSMAGCTTWRRANPGLRPAVGQLAGPARHWPDGRLRRSVKYARPRP